jgi:hypothetical protein
MNAPEAFLNGADEFDLGLLHALTATAVAPSRRSAVEPAGESQIEENSRDSVNDPERFRNDPDDPSNPNEVREQHVKKVKKLKQS